MLCALSAPAVADVVVMRFQGRITLLNDDLGVFDFPDTQRAVWGRITVDTEAPGDPYLPNAAMYDLIGVELFVGPQSFIADEVRTLTVINDNNDPPADDVFRFDGFVSVAPGDYFYIESMTFGDADWLSSLAIPDLADVRLDHPAVNGANVHLSRMIGFDHSHMVAEITDWRIVPAPAALAVLLAPVMTRRRR